LCVCIAASAIPARADTRADLASVGCAALVAAVDQVPGQGPMFLDSYPTAGQALAQAAFTYDNALALIALVSCNEVARARRIADAFVVAVAHDRSYGDHRIRNGYRAGAVLPDRPPDLAGWWDDTAARWYEDAYQAGTATGNVAWAALALLTQADAVEPEAASRYRAGAAALMGWAEARLDRRRPAGLEGGLFGFEPAPIAQHWKSTEHNIDAAAAAVWLAHEGTDPRWGPLGVLARDFVAAMWEPGAGRFLIGTGDDGQTFNREPSALDTQLWPLLAFPDAPQDWHRALDWVRGQHAVAGGYGFALHPDAVWTEGTAQMALTLGVLGDTGGAERLFPLLLAQRAPGGFLYASPQARMRTGLAIGPTSRTDDLYYFHLPHLGATAWAVLAANTWNPFRRHIH